MKSGANTLSRILTWVTLTLACGVILFGATACDPNVQAKLVSGMNAAANSAAGALIDAAFLSVTPDTSNDSGSNSSTSGTSTTPSV